MKRITTIILAALTAITVSAQQDIKKQLDNYFKGYRATGQRVRSNAHLQSLEVNDSLRTIEVCADTHLGENCITPEGTRSPNPDWKKGFYFIALKAGLPILLYGVDYEKKLIRCTKTIIPTGNLEDDMREIKLYFKDFKGKKPENFTIGDIK